MLYIATDGVCKRDCFAYGQKRAGGNAIASAEPPIPWEKTVDPYKVQKELGTFLKENHYNVNVSGDQEAYPLLQELKSIYSDRKRDIKFLTKALHEAESPKDKMKAEAHVIKDVMDRYVNTIVRCLVEPADWMNTEFPEGEGDEVRKLIIKGRLETMEGYNKNA